MTQARFMRIELGLAFLLFGFGLIMDFAPLLSHGAIWSQFISGVNNSPWERFKPFMLSFMVISLLEMGAVRLSVVRFVPVYVISLYAYTILGLFAAVLYGAGWAYYIAVFVIGIVCRLGAAAFMFTKKKPQCLFIPALAALSLYFLMFLFFTPCPPHTPLFYDTLTGQYGF
ncbi:MAG: DUF6512 family protein [Acutalibacteraceae bacterium]